MHSGPTQRRDRALYSRTSCNNRDVFRVLWLQRLVIGNHTGPHSLGTSFRLDRKEIKNRREVLVKLSPVIWWVCLSLVSAYLRCILKLSGLLEDSCDKCGKGYIMFSPGGLLASILYFRIFFFETIIQWWIYTFLVGPVFGLMLSLLLRVGVCFMNKKPSFLCPLLYSVHANSVIQLRLVLYPYPE